MLRIMTHDLLKECGQMTFKQKLKTLSCFVLLVLQSQVRSGQVEKTAGHCILWAKWIALCFCQVELVSNPCEQGCFMGGKSSFVPCAAFLFWLLLSGQGRGAAEVLRPQHTDQKCQSPQPLRSPCAQSTQASASLSVPSERARAVPEFRVRMGTDCCGKRLQWERLNHKKTFPSEHMSLQSWSEKREAREKLLFPTELSVIHLFFSTPHQLSPESHKVLVLFSPDFLYTVPFLNTAPKRAF